MYPEASGGWTEVKECCSPLAAARPLCRPNFGLGNHSPAARHTVNVLSGIAGPFLLFTSGRLLLAALGDTVLGQADLCLLLWLLGLS